MVKIVTEGYKKNILHRDDIDDCDVVDDTFGDSDDAYDDYDNNNFGNDDDDKNFGNDDDDADESDDDAAYGDVTVSNK